MLSRLSVYSYRDKVTEFIFSCSLITGTFYIQRIWKLLNGSLVISDLAPRDLHKLTILRRKFSHRTFLYISLSEHNVVLKIWPKMLQFCHFSTQADLGLKLIWSWWAICISSTKPTHNVQLEKDPTLNWIFRHFVTSSRSQRHNFFTLFSCIYEKQLKTWHIFNVLMRSPVRFSCSTWLKNTVVPRFSQWLRSGTTTPPLAISGKTVI